MEIFITPGREPGQEPEFMQINVDGLTYSGYLTGNVLKVTQVDILGIMAPEELTQFKETAEKIQKLIGR